MFVYVKIMQQFIIVIIIVKILLQFIFVRVKYCYNLYTRVTESCPMKTYHSSDRGCGLSKDVQNYAICIYYLGQLQRFRTKF